MTDDIEAAPQKPLTVAEASIALEKAREELEDSEESFDRFAIQLQNSRAKFKAADRALTAAYLATRQKKGPRKPKSEGAKP